MEKCGATMNSQPLISCIVAVYNGAKYLQRCIDSVANQTYPHKELIIIDGGSTDGTLEILQANDKEIAYWESKPDRGIYHAWNKALEHVRGDWVYFLGVDDYLWQPNVLQRLSKHLVEAASAGVKIVWGQVAIVTEQGDILQIVNKPKGGVDQPKWGNMEIINTQGLFYFKSLFDEHGKFDETFSIAGDTDFLLRTKTAAGINYIDGIVIAGYGYGGISSVPVNKIQVFREITRAFRKNKVSLNRTVLLWIYAKVIINACMLRLIGFRGAGYVADFYRLITGRSVFWTRIK